MNIFNRTYLKLASVCIGFTLMFYLLSSKMTNYLLDYNMELVCNVYYDQIIEKIEKDMDLLISINEYLSTNEIIVSYLEDSRDKKDVKEKGEKALNQILRFEDLLDKISFIESLKVLDLNNNTVFNQNSEEQKFDITKRPWYSEDIFSSKEKKTKITQRHLSRINGKDEIAIISIVNDRRDNSTLGAIILDIYVDDLLKNIENSFKVGSLETFIYSYYTNPSVLDIDKSKYNVYINKDLLNNGEDLVFKFEKSTLINNDFTKESLKKIRYTLLITGICIGILLFISIIVCFKSSLVAIKKLKNILSKLNNNYSIEEKNEFRQLEIIADSIDKTFDDKIQELIYYDSLTKLPNRKSLRYLCEKYIKNKKDFALMFIDLNKFKNINDMFGHSVGDEYLVKFSNILKEIIKDKGLATRYSGDEFILIYDKYKNDEDLLDFYNKTFMDIFSKPIVINEKLTTEIKFSIGVASYPRDGDTFEDLINKSDFMMYINKKNLLSHKLSFFDENMYTKLLYVEKIKSKLKFALYNEEFYLNYQPIINKDKNILKAEALIRWNNKELGFVPPDKFIKYLEETREIINVGYWIIDKVCKDIKHIKNNGKNIQISVNISPLQIMLKDFIPNVTKIIDKYGVSYSDLCFEITETVLLDNKESVLENINKIKELGILISLDDFGTGYSSFNYLRSYKLDILKIDKSFLRNDDKLDFDIINQIKEIAHLLNIEVVMEGVETKEQFDIISKIGIDYIQGYYFSKPLSLKDFEDKLKE